MSLIGLDNVSIGRTPARFNAETTSSSDLMFGILFGEVDSGGNLVNFSDTFDNVKFGIKRYLDQATLDYETDSLTGRVMQTPVTVDGIDYLHISLIVPLAEKPVYALGFCEFLAIYADGTRRPLNIGQYINANGVIE